jgi:hypothetical protein
MSSLLFDFKAEGIFRISGREFAKGSVQGIYRGYDQG